MTCAGLLGLAFGHGVSASAAGGKPVPTGGVDDDQVKRGLIHLSDLIAAEQSQPPGSQVEGAYFLWSVERVGVTYNLRMIGDKDWYAWGSEPLMKNQKEDGSFSPNPKFFTPQVETCFALLFLKRANLAKDLTAKIEYLIDVKGVGMRETRKGQ
jgi:hypothetical protein